MSNGSVRGSLIVAAAVAFIPVLSGIALWWMIKVRIAENRFLARHFFTENQKQWIATAFALVIWLALTLTAIGLTSWN